MARRAQVPPPNPAADSSPKPRTVSPIGPRVARLGLPAGVLFLLGLGVWGASLAWQASVRQQPILDLLDRLGTRQGPERLEARERLVGDPTKVAPVLVGLVRRGKTRWHTEILPWLESIPRISRHRTIQARRERLAIDVLQRMGTAAAPAVLPLLADSRYGGRENGIALLRSYGPAAVPVLIDALGHRQAAIRAGAALTLGRFPEELAVHLEPLSRARQDPVPEVRRAAVWALGQMGTHPRSVLPELVAALADPAPAVRLQTLQMLRLFEARAEPALPELRRLLADDTSEFRAEAALTLAALGPAGRAAEPELLALVRRRDPRSSGHAAATLVQLELHAGESLDLLRTFLAHRDPGQRARTADLAGTLGPRGAPLVPALARLLENDETRDDRATLGALRQIAPEAIPERFRRGRRPAPATAPP
jgi:HEAT repeat protein